MNDNIHFHVNKVLFYQESWTFWLGCLISAMVPYRSRSRNKGSGPNYIDIVIPGDTRAKEKEQEKIEKYEALKEEVGKGAGGEESGADSNGAISR